MCGIFGFSRITDVTRRMAPILALAMEDRGRDSWGATNGRDEIIKHLGPIHRTWSEEVNAWAGWETGIFHTRAASTGAITIPNQHPFVVEKDGRIIIGIHNGIVTNHEILNKKHNRTFECDSPHIFMAIAGFSTTNEIMGYGNLAWYERTMEDANPRLFLARFNGDNLFVAQLNDGEVVFCSLKEPLEKAAMIAGSEVKTLYATGGDVLYSVHPLEDDPTRDGLFRVRPMPFGTRAYPIPPHEFVSIDGRARRYGGYTYNPSPELPIDQLGAKDRADNICLGSGCTHKVIPTRRKALLCEECFSKVIREMKPIVRVAGLCNV